MKNMNINNNKKRKGFLLIEAVAVLGITSLFISITAPVIKNSIEIKTTVVNEVRYERNFLHIMKNINRELKSAYEINILENGSRCEALYKFIQMEI